MKAAKVLSDDLAEAFRSIKTAIQDDRSLERTFREQLLEQLEFLAQQAAAPADRRKHGLIRAVFMALDAAARNAPGIPRKWHKLRALLVLDFDPPNSTD